LELADHEIVSRWVNMPFNPTESHTVDERKAIAKMDADDVAACDCLILLSGPAKYSGGKFVESGIALALGKRVVVVGARENMLLWHPAVEQIDDVREFTETA
jgi:nucleoside 2-deoxyribosyltransferase